MRLPHLSKLFYTLVLTCTLFFGLEMAHAARTQNQDFEVTEKMRAETRYVIQSLENLHYSGKPFTSIQPQEIVKNYISDLDMNHLFFLEPQVTDYIERFSPTLDVYLQQGNIYPAFIIFKNYREQANNRLQWVFKRLKEPFHFDTPDEFKPNRREENWPKTEAEADLLWEKRLKYELLNEILSEDSKKSVTKPETTYEEKAKENVLKRYQRLLTAINKIDANEVQEIFLTTITQIYDPHSTFLSSDSLEDFSISLHNSLIGIGAILLDEDGYCTVKELIPGGPAALSKQINVGDKIIGVSQGGKPFVDIIGMKLRDAVDLIRGKQGSEVHLLISPAENGDPANRKTVILVREPIKISANISSARLYELPDGDKTVKIGVIDVPAFYGPTDNDTSAHSTTEDVAELIKKLQALGIEGLILDLRNNGGGLLNEAVSLTGLFIPIGPVLQVRDSFGRVKEYFDTNPRVAWKGPLIVLTSRYSASASEIVSGALKSYKRAIVVGDASTHGKGTVQVILEVDRPMFAPWAKQQKMGATKITIQKWYLPDGNSIQLKGVPSDITIPSVNDYTPIGESDLPNALEWDAIHPLPWEDMDTFRDYVAPVKESSLVSLREASQKRQQTLEEFKFLNNNINRFKEKQENKEVSLDLKKRIQLLNDDELFRNQAKDELRALAKNNFKFEPITLNGYENVPITENMDDNEALLDPNDTDTEKLPEFDVDLRESLRVMKDWLNIRNARIPDQALASQTEAPNSKQDK